MRKKDSKYLAMPDPRQVGENMEREQAFVRLIVGAVLFLYLLPASFVEPHGDADRLFLVAMVCYLVLVVAIYTWIRVSPGPSPLRRVCVSVLDVSAATFFMFNTAEYGAPLYAVYLLIIFGHGFRYGKPYLYTALLLSTIGFALVLGFNEYWIANSTLGIGLMGGMILLSLFVGKLVTRLFEALRREEAAN